jgi:non-ribosomal peptide synthetase component E (peptide arylation enzyme)
VAAFVVTSASFDLAECQRWFAQRGLAKFKTPERVITLDELPLLGSGKPDRAQLQRRAAG